MTTMPGVCGTRAPSSPASRSAISRLILQPAILAANTASLPAIYVLFVQRLTPLVAGCAVIKRLSVNALLKSVIATLAAVVVVLLALGAWESWGRLQSVNRITAVVDVSTHLFTALHNLRVDRASSFRDLMEDKQFTGMNQQVRDARAAELPALRSTIVALERVDIPDRQAVIEGLNQAIKRLIALHEESAPAFLRPKAERRPGLAQELFNETNGLLQAVDNLSGRLMRLVKLDDAFVDHVLQLQQLAMVV